ncbi:MAG: NAD(P)H-dependent oxidoreductase subunit E [Oscillospiraceae bacterium]|nr:NAD(P)H-dependent oxidoreductase subunit E [Oscillospiraceae bacterium]
MAKSIATIPFTGTPTQEQELRAVIDALREDPGCLMPIMQKAQEIYGYLPIEVQQIIATELNIPLEKVFGVATFYAQFTMSPKGKYRISVCLGTACYVKGSGVVMEKLEEALGIKGGEITQDGKFSLDDCRCVGACGLAPVVTINDDVYGRLAGKPEEIQEILAKYAD